MTTKKFDQATVHQGAGHSMPYPASRLAASVDLVDLAKEIAHADTLVNTRVNAQLQVIAEQIRSLQEQARTILSHAQKDQLLHRAQCSFKRIPGKTYHLYEKENGVSYFSLLSPREWGEPTPHDFKGSYRLEADMSWTEIGAAQHKQNAARVVQNLLDMDQFD